MKQSASSEQPQPQHRPAHTYSPLEMEEGRVGVPSPRQAGKREVWTDTSGGMLALLVGAVVGTGWTYGVVLRGLGLEYTLVFAVFFALIPTSLVMLRITDPGSLQPNATSDPVIATLHDIEERQRLERGNGSTGGVPPAGLAGGTHTSPHASGYTGRVYLLSGDVVVDGKTYFRDRKGQWARSTTGGHDGAERYCATCHLWRTKGVSHCSACGFCFRGFDHHCGVIGVCVAADNHRWFSLLLLAGAGCSLMSCVGAIVRIAHDFDGWEGWEIYLWILTILTMGYIGLSLLLFAVVHVTFMVCGATTKSCSFGEDGDCRQHPPCMPWGDRSPARLAAIVLRRCFAPVRARRR
ncbi:unnamed protein product [Pedinophyceae sp. YPF-701]|nr:unnamed protein product [Pedinophyceae sp. YPF-701]